MNKYTEYMFMCLRDYDDPMKNIIIQLLLGLLLLLSPPPYNYCG